MSGLANRAGLWQTVRPSGERYPIDVVFVVDGTESMTPLLERVKMRILTLDGEIEKELRGSNRVLDSLRARLIVFRDLYDDPETAFEMTKFFDLPAQREEFENTVKVVEAFGGDDAPESGLEAVFLAMRSPWRNEPQDLKRRHIVMLFTDQDAHELGATIPPSYAQPPHPRTMSDLKKLWGPRTRGGLMNDRARRMVLFAPEEVKTREDSASTWWNEMRGWESVWIERRNDEGLIDLNWDEVVKALVATI
jgi:hypothetical protein